MTRVLHVATSDMSLELLLGPQLRSFQAAGFEMHAASGRGPFIEGLVEDGIVHHELRYATRAKALHRDLAALWELHTLFRWLRPDIVHTHNPKPGIYGRMAGRTARVPRVINTQHGIYAQPDDPLLLRLAVYSLERLAGACSDIELVQSPEDLDQLGRLGIPRQRLWFLGNGIDLQRFRPRPELRDEVRAELGIAPHEVLIGMVGRLVREKGYVELFEAARMLKRSQPHLRWITAGPTDMLKEDALTKSELRMGREAGVKSLGFRDDPERLYQAMDICALPSHREGWPRAAMEAAASAVPIIATDIRGCRQVIHHGITGLLVPPRNPRALAGSIAELAANPSQRASFADAAAALAISRFGQDKVIETCLNAYLSRGAPTPSFNFPGAAYLPARRLRG